jgi:4-methyl-5(b-hydroxyethyl)-thiazole monophosphate biosynthesis
MSKMKSAIFLADGFEDCEGLITVDMLRRGKQEIDTVSMNDTCEVHTSHGVTMLADKVFSEIDPAYYDILILPGGKRGVVNLEKSEPLKKILLKHFNEGKLTCAICAAPSLLGHIGILKGRKYTCFPGFEEDSFDGEYQMELAVEDGSLITGRGMGATIEFARTILKKTAPEVLKDVEYGMQYEHSFRSLAK